MIQRMNTDDTLSQKLALVLPFLDERTRRLVLASEAMSLGFGGIARVHRASGLSRKAISKGIAELESGEGIAPGRIRRPGAGRKRLTLRDPKISDALTELIEPDTRGDPESPLRWTSKSTRSIARELSRSAHPVSHTKVAQLLHEQNYSLQSNRKTEEGKNHPDRDAQFLHINTQVKRALKAGWPVISVDTKKEELLGNYANSGQQRRRSKNPLRVNGHDFPSPEIPRAYPYGIYDLGRNTGFVNVGTDHDTGEFAVASIRGWWLHEGQALYPKAHNLVITADGGGSNGHRPWLWKWELQKLADETGLSISILHFPPGTSKWNKIEHRLFFRVGRILP